MVSLFYIVHTGKSKQNYMANDLRIFDIVQHKTIIDTRSAIDGMQGQPDCISVISRNLYYLYSTIGIDVYQIRDQIYRCWTLMLDKESTLPKGETGS